MNTTSRVIVSTKYRQFKNKTENSWRKYVLQLIFCVLNYICNTATEKVFGVVVVFLFVCLFLIHRIHCDTPNSKKSIQFSLNLIWPKILHIEIKTFSSWREREHFKVCIRMFAQLQNHLKSETFLYGSFLKFSFLKYPQTVNTLLSMHTVNKQC